jgi:uroporphyrinogen III methyltransferase/synthase
MTATRIEGPSFPLENRNIVLTQSEYQLEKLKKYLSLEKATPVYLPCIESKIIFTPDEMDQAFKDIRSYDWVIFTSQNAFLLLHEYLKKKDKLHHLKRLHIATVGHETKDTIEKFGFSISFTPKVPKTSVEFFDQFMAEVNLKEKKILFPRSKRSVSKIPQNLVDGGASITPFEFYDALPHPQRQELYEHMVASNPDWLTFSSPTAVNSFFSIRGEDDIRHWVFGSGVKIASIGPTTSQALAEHRVPVSCESPQPNVRWMLETMKAFEKYESWTE